MRTSGHDLTHEVDHHQQCLLYGMKNRIYCYSCFNMNKPNNKTPLCQVKRNSKVTKRKNNQSFMMLWNSNSKRGLTKLTNRCTSVSVFDKRISMENGRKNTKKVIEEDEESTDDISVERVKITVKEVEKIAQ